MKAKVVIRTLIEKEIEVDDEFKDLLNSEKWSVELQSEFRDCIERKLGIQYLNEYNERFYNEDVIIEAYEPNTSKSLAKFFIDERN